MSPLPVSASSPFAQGHMEPAHKCKTMSAWRRKSHTLPLPKLQLRHQEHRRHCIPGNCVLNVFFLPSRETPRNCNRDRKKLKKIKQYFFKKFIQCGSPTIISNFFVHLTDLLCFSWWGTCWGPQASLRHKNKHKIII